MQHQIMNSLDQLKADPQIAINNNHYYLEPSVYSSELGVNFLLTSNGNIHRLSMLQAYTNYCEGYYFPYKSIGLGEIGHISLPAGRIFDGAIAITSGMNGCALEVRYEKKESKEMGIVSEGIYHFYHDANGRQEKLMEKNATTVCRISNDTYWPPQKQINALMIKYKGSIPTVQFICIYRHGYWHVVCCGFFLGLRNGTSSEIVATFDPLGGKYRGRFNAGTHLIET